MQNTLDAFGVLDIYCTVAFKILYKLKIIISIIL